MRTNLIVLVLMSIFVTPVMATKPELTGEGEGKPTEEQKAAHKIIMEAKLGLDKGSDKGKESREANSKKWWKFWGE